MDQEVQGKFCRLCAHNDIELFSVFDVKDGFQFCDIINQHLHLKIRKSDTISTDMCSSCKEKVINFHEYFLMCQRVQQWFLDSDPFREDNKNIDEAEPVFDKSIFVAENSIDVPENDIKIENDFDNDSLAAEITADLLDTKDDSGEEHSEELIAMVLKPDLDVKEQEPPLKTQKIRKFRKRKYDKKKIQFQCSRCELNCSSWYQLKKHSLSKHGIKPSVKCFLCQVLIHSKSVLYAHVSQHNNTKLYKCDECPKITNTAESLKKHKERHVPKDEKIFHCDLCTKTTKTRHGLEKHRMVHIPIEQRQVFPCDICNMKFTTERTVMQHKKVVHDKIKCIMCDLCGYTCATRFELEQHRPVHSNLKLYECSMCFKRFKTESNLRTHMDTHEGTSYQCEICNKVLNTRRTFRKHKLVHEVVRNFICSYCNISFKRKQSLQIHMNSHTGDKPISCKWCDERFMYWASLRTHKQRHHPDKLMTK